MKKKFYTLGTALMFFWLFTISNAVTAQQPYITLIQPTGPNIEITQGSTYLISWNDNFVQPVNIYFSADGGASYTTLALNVLGTTYLWNTTGLNIGTLYRIKVESQHGTYYDVSSQNFSIVDEVNGYITLNQPTGGEAWAEGKTYLISWDDNLTAPVKVELYHSSTLVETISSSATGSTVYWTIPQGYVNTYGSTNWRIKVSSTVTNAVTSPATSGYFTINESAGSYITVLQPGGGESWALGTTHLISWIDDVPEPVDVILYRGNDIDTLAQDVVGSTYYWTLSDTIPMAGGYRIKVISSLDATLIGLSNTFNIIKSEGTFITVYQPNGGERWALGTTHLISWNDDLPEPVDIILYRSNNDIDTLAQDVVGSTYYWTLSDTILATAGYRIKVISTKEVTLYDFSDLSFTISKSAGTNIEVIQPNGNESWAVNTTHLISWIDDVPEPVDIVLFRGGDIDTLAQDVIGSTYYWTISDTTPASTGYRIKVVSTKDANLYDISDAGFSITLSTGTYEEVLQPNGGETWARGTAHLISWIDDMPEAVNIELLTGGTVYDTLATNVVGSTWVWDISDTTATATNYRIRVSSTIDPTHLKDVSNGYFAISASAGTYVEVLQPNGGEQWVAGSSYLVSWIDDAPEPMNVVVMTGNAVTDTIVLNAIGTTYVWDIPTTYSTGYNYRVKVYSTLDPTHITDVSDGYFTIYAMPMAAIYPNPANNYVTLELNGTSNEPCTIEMYDRFNNKVINTIVNPARSNSVKLSTQNLPNGIYFITITSSAERVTKKVIVQH